ncbi:MAG: hypothetical protein E7445_06860 [Ruminococcaceae bacterium]|nr:hypothetical protein [Oscillospiraceae bacterium]
MKKISLEKTMDQLKMLVVLGVITYIVLVVNKARAGGALTPDYLINLAIGVVVIGLICLLGLKIKEVVPLKIPAFAWASLLGTVLAFPFWPWHAWFLNVTGGVGAGVAGTVILALTGISIGTKLADLKKISWRIAIVSIFVFCGTFFGSAIVAQIIMKVQGII